MSKNMQIHVGADFDATAKRVAASWHKAERGEDVNEDHLTFVSWDSLAKVTRFAQSLHCEDRVPAKAHILG